MAPKDLELLRALYHNIRLFADDVPHINVIDLKRELRRQNHKLKSLIAREKIKVSEIFPGSIAAILDEKN